MPPIFSPRANLFAWLSVGGLFGMFFLTALAAYFLSSSSYVTNLRVHIDQPVPFSHAHHVAGLGIDCRYCHTAVETSSNAGMPSSDTCMNCHSQIWTGAPMLKQVRESYRKSKRIHWNRVYNLPDYIYFNHSIHVSKGIGCVTCHGRIDKQPLTEKSRTLFMSWCLNCHRDPTSQIRPLDEVYNMKYKFPPNQAQLGKKLAAAHDVKTTGLTNCSTCHR